MTIYEELFAANCTIDHHESDLYAKVDAKSRPIIERRCWVEHEHKCSLFQCAKTQQLWWEIPFAYDPFWDAYNQRCLAGR